MTCTELGFDNRIIGEAALSMGVAMAAGSTALTSDPPSSAIACVSPAIAALLVAYAVKPGFVIACECFYVND